MRYNGNKFSVYESEEKTVLGLLDELGSQVNHNTDTLDSKTDLHGNHLGQWQGLSRPTMSEEGMRATVEDIVDNKIPSIQLSLDNKVGNVITDTLNDNLINTKAYSNDKNNKIIKSTTTITGNNSEVQGINIECSTTETFRTTTDVTNVKIHHNNIVSENMGVHINSNNVKNVTIQDNFIEGGNFPVLVNDNSLGSENINIINNNIISTTGGDCVELNCPTSDENVDITCTNMKVLNNTLESKYIQGSSNSKGFSIGIAQGKNIVVANNISKESNQEGLHLEDAYKSVLVNNNIFDSTGIDGARINSYNRTDFNKRSDTPIITNNMFIKKGETKAGIGIRLIADAYNYVDLINISNNKVRGYEHGLSLEKNLTYAIADNFIIENTKYGINGCGILKGTIVTKNVDTPIKNLSNRRLEVENLITTTPTNHKFIENNNTSSVILSSLNLNRGDVSVGDGYTDIKLIKTPKGCKGNLQVELGNGDLIVYYDISYNGSELNHEKLYNPYNGLGFGNLSLNIVDDSISIKIYKVGGYGMPLKLRVKFEGNIIY